MELKPSLAIIGAGKVGTALTRLWSARGYPVTAVASRTHAHAESLAHEIRTAATSPLEAVSRADLVFICVPDDSIALVAEQVAAADWADKAAVHTSGAYSLDLLHLLSERGAMTGSLHPAYPFARADLPPDALRGITFALESDHPRLSQWLYALVDAAEGRALTLRPDSKPLYHAALVLTSNYAVTLYAASLNLLLGLGAEGDAADGALNALLSGTLDNLRLRGIPDALTGPLARGDTGTVEAHLSALQATPDIQAAYLALARLTLPLLVERKLDTGAIARLLQNWEGL